MSLLRKVLYPFSVLYGEITALRNLLYDKGFFKSSTFNIPTIVVGNLSVGGTGKSPQIEYLIRLLKDQFKVATLSRGYKRKTKGFLLASKGVKVADIGDEPFQFYKKYPKITVCVDANRVEAIKRLKNLETPPDVILLDDAFQHRKVAGGFNILLTPYGSLYVDDTMLPKGNLREKVSGAERAQVIIVTKCPVILSENEQFEITKKIKPTLYQTVFFTTILYANFVKSSIKKIEISALKEYHVVLVTGIANPKPLLSFLENKVASLQHVKFADHHDFSKQDIKNIQQQYKSIIASKKMILTTEKDFMRLSKHIDTAFFIGIETKFLSHQKDFDQLILNYILKTFKENVKSLHD